MVESLEARSRIPVCLEVPIIIESARGVEGFDSLPVETQINVLSFIESHHDYLFDGESEQVREKYFDDLSSIRLDENVKSIAFQASMKARDRIAQTQRSTK